MPREIDGCGPEAPRIHLIRSNSSPTTGIVRLTKNGRHPNSSDAGRSVSAAACGFSRNSVSADVEEAVEGLVSAKDVKLQGIEGDQLGMCHHVVDIVAGDCLPDMQT